MTRAVGEKAPDFTLPTTSGQPFTLSETLGRRTVVLFFYPKDNTPGCTVEACTFRDHYEAFAEAGAEVIGVSSDSEASHADFASKHKLPMTLLTDAGGKVRALYDVRSTLGLLPGGPRSSSTAAAPSRTFSCRSCGSRRTSSGRSPS